jgi:hypothetical protein
MADDDRRERPRGTCALHVYLELAGGDPVLCRSADLSASGIALVSDKYVAPGTDALFHLRIGLGWSGDDFLTLLGRVVWSRAEGSRVRLGAQFDPSLDAKQRRRLDRLVRRLLGEDEIGALRQRFAPPRAPL